MILDGGIHINFNTEDRMVSIQVTDKGSGNFPFLKVNMSLKEFFDFSRGLYHADCKLDINHLERVGKKRITEPFEFELGKITIYSSERKEIAKRKAKELCPEGWIPDLYFDSKSSFFIKDGVLWAKTVMRRWE